jgi:hypothetical protein
MAFRRKNIKHKHGNPNPVIDAEEQVMLAQVDKALSSSGNSQTIGRNGELPLQSFLSRYLPNTLSARSGHFVTPSGLRSPQIDIMIIDSRYPLLAENSDGSVLAMLHSVVYCIEVKTNIQTTDLAKMSNHTREIISLVKNGFAKTNGDPEVGCIAFAYRSECRAKTLADEYFDIFVDGSTHTDLYLLRVPDSDQNDMPNTGALLHLEPIAKENEIGEYETDAEGRVIVEKWLPYMSRHYTPLSDMYYRLIQNSYYELESRNFSFGNIGAHLLKYMSWSTAPSKWK